MPNTKGREVSAATICKRCHRVFTTRGARPCPHCGFSPSGALSPSLPKTRLLALRSDVVMEPVEEEGTLYYIIKDPRLGGGARPLRREVL